MNHPDGEIDYRKYSPRELREAQSGINPENYPKNFENLIGEFERRGLLPEKPKEPQATARDDSTEIYSEEAESPNKARMTGFLTLVFGVAWFLFRYDDGVYHGRRGREYTFDDDPIFLTFIFVIHGSVVLIGLLGLIFGSQFYRDLIHSRSFSSPFRRRD